MLPFFDLTLWGHSFRIASHNALLGFALLTSVLILSRGLRQGRGFWQSSAALIQTAGLVAVVAAAGIVGGRLLHVVWERPQYFRQHPGEIFTDWNGSIFYGALTLAAIAFAGLARWLLPVQAARQRFWDLGAICAALCVGFLRTACFADGCCWGKVTNVPWAVVYLRGDSVMPFLAVPVHPVQLYDAAAGLLIAGVLTALYRAGRRASASANGLSAFLAGHLASVFCVLYAIERTITENFRGDDFRGVDLVAGLSTSQIISIVLAAVVSIRLARLARGRGQTLRSLPAAMPVTALTLVLAFLLAGCLPEAPDSDTIQSVRRLNAKVEVNKITMDKPTHRNALYVAANGELGSPEAEARIQGAIQSAYQSRERKPADLEELSWWFNAPLMGELYDYVVRIAPGHFYKDTLLRSLKWLESQRTPYDVILLTHGFQSLLVSSESGQPAIFDFDLADLKGKLPHLNLVFMQACFGSSMAPTWLDAGARVVISYPDLNRNFFYLPFYLRKYDADHGDAIRAFSDTNATIEHDLKRSLTFGQVIRSGLGVTTEQYLETAPNPEIVARAQRVR